MSRYAIVGGCVVPAPLAPILHDLISATGAHPNAVYRGADAEPLLHKLGKHSQAELYDDFVHHRVGANPANPPGRSTHELRSDGVAYPQWRAGAAIPWWACGMDWNDSDVPKVIAAAAKRGWVMFRPYSSGSEYHHLNFRKPPVRKRLSAKARRLVDAKLALKMKRAGIVNPLWTIRAARTAALPIALACAFLEQETGGGRNVFGHDPSICCGWGSVTAAKYKRYRRLRGRRGEGGMQGVGPMQLTWYELQDEADREGGCWNPYPNMLVGFRHATQLIRRNGMHLGVRAYNGSGPAAERYADSVIAKAQRWAKLLDRPLPA